ncbi:MAG: VanZ family protein [Planctomycetaceae bacterium]
MSPLDVKSPSVRSLHAAACFLMLAVVSWALLTPDPFAVVKGGPLQVVAGFDDLVLHLGVYTVFSATCFGLVADSRDRRVRNLVVAILCLHAVGTEILQASVPGRTADPLDAVANLTGITLGVLGTRHTVRLLRSRIVSATA